MAIICGAPRSGTTALSSLVALATGRELIMEPPIAIGAVLSAWRGKPFSGEEIGMLRREAVVKSPVYAYIIGSINDVAPDVPVVFIVRDPRDAIASLFELRAHNQRSPSTKLFVGREKTYHSESDLLLLAARRWLLMYMEAENGRCFTVKYEDFVEDCLYWLDSVVRYCEWPFRAPSEKQLNRTYAKSWGGQSGVGRWEGVLDSDQADKIVEICGSRMEELGYS